MTELAEEFEGQLTFFRENTKKYITFSVPIEAEGRKFGTMEVELQRPRPILQIKIH